MREKVDGRRKLLSLLSRLGGICVASCLMIYAGGSDSSVWVSAFMKPVNVCVCQSANIVEIFDFHKTTMELFCNEMIASTVRCQKVKIIFYGVM